MIRRILPLALLLLVGLASCAPPPELRNEAYLNDTSLITGEPCEAPCWNDIIPGETGWRDARIMVEDDRQLTNVTLSDVEEGGQLLVFNAGDGPQCCQLYTRDGQVVNTILTLLAPEMQIDDVIEVHGEPEYLTAADVTPDQALILMIFPDVPMGLYVFAPGLAEGEIAPENEVIGAIYFEPEELDVILNANLYRWEGYGKLSDIIDGNFDVTAETEPSGGSDGEGS